MLYFALAATMGSHSLQASQNHPGSLDLRCYTPHATYTYNTESVT
jgi:hypothetical protein